MVLYTYPEIELIGYILLPYYELNNVMYGDRLITHGDYTYIFGRKEDDSTWHIPYAHLARTEVGNLLGDWGSFIMEVSGQLILKHPQG